MIEKNLLVLAGGFGTRLRSAVPDVPKPLAPVAGKPFLHYQLENWLRQGIRSVTFLLFHQAELIEAFLAKFGSSGLLRDCAVRTLREPAPLGTGGAIAFAVRELALREAFLVANADTWLGGGLSEVSLAPAPAIAVIEVPNTERYGSVLIGPDSRVTSFNEKQNCAGLGAINAGLYHLQPSDFDSWDGAPFSLEREVFPALLGVSRLRAVELTSDFIDIGVPADYQRFCSWVDSGRKGNL